MNDIEQLLESVSRSFYLSMRFLPGRMRPGVSIAYLLARATDTVADSSRLPAFERVAVLEELRQAIHHSEEGACPKLLSRLREEYCPDLVHEGEKVLLHRFDEELALLKGLPARQKELVVKVLNIIIDGQRWDLEYFAHDTHVQSDDILDLYTYRVAGCVGEFWTEMGFVCYGERFSYLSPEKMLQMGRLYGEGLQLVNVLRDKREDELNGRFYIPNGDSEEELRRWEQKAREKLEQGISYARALKGFRMRFTTVLPAMLGIDTLNLWASRPRLTDKVKITRSVVRKRIFQAILFSFRLFR